MINRPLLFLSFALAGILAVGPPARAEVKLPSVFSDHMVLQRDASVPVWGWADPGEVVAVSIAGQTKTATTDAQGRWSVKLDNLPTASEPVTMTVKGKNTITVSDVLIGEVWLASGQSNMQMGVNGVTNAWQEKATAKFPQIRMFTVARRTAVTPQTNCAGAWIVCSPETVGNFSAAAYFFGRELHQTQKTPVGLLNASWGGTAIEAWTSISAQEGKSELTPVFEVWRQKTSVPYDEGKAMAQYHRQMTVWTNVSEKSRAAGKPLPQQPKVPVAPRLQSNHPANLFNGMIAPLIPYAIRGAIWYQGENNSRGEFARIYATQLPLLIQDWRQRWDQGPFPFAWVQLPNFKKPTADPGAVSDWSVMRESMLRSLTVPNTGMAITIDVGDEANIHPRDKQTVGRRLALWARAKVYGEPIPFSGPLPAGHQIKDGAIMVNFTHADRGLVARGGELKGFAIAGADQKWVWAQAKIEGSQVTVLSPEVKSPVAVRYAWADNPDCNLYSGAGLPASPFRTDNW
jgi:sialate O-acetylesterase